MGWQSRGQRVTPGMGNDWVWGSVHLKTNGEREEKWLWGGTKSWGHEKVVVVGEERGTAKMERIASQNGVD